MKSLHILSSDGKTRLACYRTECKKPLIMLQISHGMCEYFKRYSEFATYLARRGILVFGHDHLGHGETAPTEAELGFTAEGGGANFMVEDVHNLSLNMMDEYPNVPLVLFGHSMGSFIAREVMARYGEDEKAMYDAGLSYAIEQIVDLLASGVEGIHFYAMNNPPVVEAIYNSIKSLIDSANSK